MLKILRDQINSSPEPLRTYIHDIETASGTTADIIQELYQLRENVKFLCAFIEEAQTINQERG